MIQTGQPPASASLMPGLQVCGCTGFLGAASLISWEAASAGSPLCLPIRVHQTEHLLSPSSSASGPQISMGPSPSLEPRVLQASPALRLLPLPQQPPNSAIASLCPPSPPAFRVLGSDEAPVLGRTWGCALFTPDTHLLSSVRACPSVPSCCPVTRLLGPGLLRAWI